MVCDVDGTHDATGTDDAERVAADAIPVERPKRSKESPRHRKSANVPSEAGPYAVEEPRWQWATTNQGHKNHHYDPDHADGDEGKGKQTAVPCTGADPLQCGRRIEIPPGLPNESRLSGGRLSPPGAQHLHYLRSTH